MRRKSRIFSGGNNCSIHSSDYRQDLLLPLYRIVQRLRRLCRTLSGKRTRYSNVSQVIASSSFHISLTKILHKQNLAHSCESKYIYLAYSPMDDEEIYLKCEQLLAIYSKEYKFDEQDMRTIQIAIGSDEFLKMLMEREGRRIRIVPNLNSQVNDPAFMWEYVVKK